MVYLKISEVNYRDLGIIVNLEQDVFRKNAFPKKLLKKLLNTHQFFLKLEKGQIKKELVGFIIVLKDGKEAVNIVNFLIKPNHQNKGFGSYLLQQTIEKIKELKLIKKIALNVQISNQKAIKMYEKFNFKRNPTILENYYNTGESAYLMELEINS